MYPKTCSSGEKASFHRERWLRETPLGPSSRPRIYWTIGFITMAITKTKHKVSSNCRTVLNTVYWISIMRILSNSSCGRFLVLSQKSILYIGLQGSPVIIPDSKVHGANMGPIWGRQDPGGPHAGPMNFAIWDCKWSAPMMSRYVWWSNCCSGSPWANTIIYSYAWRILLNMSINFCLYRINFSVKRSNIRTVVVFACRWA